MASEVTDPDLLQQLNGQQEITDPDLLAQLEGPSQTPYTAPDMSAPLKNNPLAGMPWWQNAIYGFGQTVPNLVTGAEQRYAQLTGNQPRLAQLQAQTASDRALLQPVNSTIAGKTGQILGTAAVTAPAMLIPGMQGVGGGALLGGASGLFQPTTANENPLLNAGVGAAAGGAGAYGSKFLGNWLSQRAAAPLAGWTPEAANEVAAASVGSDAPKLDQPANAAAYKAMQSVFTRARSPDVTVPVSDETANVLESAPANLNTVSAQKFAQIASVKNLTAHLGETPTAEQLGNISSQLGKDATAEFSGNQGADPMLGKSLMALREHVDDLVGGSITDPSLSSAYAGVRSQYRNYLNITHSTGIYNSSSGNVNMTALGKYLQGADEAGYMRAGNQSPLYQAARWGQATGEGKGAPRFTLENALIPWASYWATNNPISRRIGGVASRALNPLYPALQPGLPGAAIGAAQQFNQR